jgi:hypothetical protein
MAENGRQFDGHELVAEMRVGLADSASHYFHEDFVGAGIVEYQILEGEGAMRLSEDGSGRQGSHVDIQSG